MKTAVRNATAHDTRSISTANTSPIEATAAGTTSHPQQVVLDRGDQDSPRVKIVW